ncbi:uncharacterized protein MYCFIDRAFT_177621 [Pseudocercospora fijiensis CIRAD86]|uniref:Uncharacterized protein n=1 Tax=Pseudocercospora fijiensis (strain CIRAD86) TaxID=383855 RepID=M3A7V2_PSEFD|nr:uncharacterized protein MYCFIDRAFT_177621 [Pseudocercospora fijiensis CIRAD86]EME80686.1 hypothetical protein MYCFIDRAFT_177621 [Pseudocercospora fijiensis CIRAD86]
MEVRTSFLGNVPSSLPDTGGILPRLAELSPSHRQGSVKRFWEAEPASLGFMYQNIAIPERFVAELFPAHASGQTCLILFLTQVKSGLVCPVELEHRRPLESLFELVSQCWESADATLFTHALAQTLGHGIFATGIKATLNLLFQQLRLENSPATALRDLESNAASNRVKQIHKHIRSWLFGQVLASKRLSHSSPRFPFPPAMFISCIFGPTPCALARSSSSKNLVIDVDERDNSDTRFDTDIKMAVLEVGARWSFSAIGQQGSDAVSNQGGSAIRRIRSPSQFALKLVVDVDSRGESILIAVVDSRKAVGPFQRSSPIVSTNRALPNRSSKPAKTFRTVDLPLSMSMTEMSKLLKGHRHGQFVGQQVSPNSPGGGNSEGAWLDADQFDWGFDPRYQLLETAAHHAEFVMSGVRLTLERSKRFNYGVGVFDPHWWQPLQTPSPFQKIIISTLISTDTQQKSKKKVGKYQPPEEDSPIQSRSRISADAKSPEPLPRLFVIPALVRGYIGKKATLCTKTLPNFGDVLCKGAQRISEVSYCRSAADARGVLAAKTEVMLAQGRCSASPTISSQYLALATQLEDSAGTPYQRAPFWPLSSTTAVATFRTYTTSTSSTERNTPAVNPLRCTSFLIFPPSERQYAQLPLLRRTRIIINELPYRHSDSRLHAQGGAHQLVMGRTTSETRDTKELQMISSWSDSTASNAMLARAPADTVAPAKFGFGHVHPSIFQISIPRFSAGDLRSIPNAPRFSNLREARSLPSLFFTQPQSADAHFARPPLFIGKST